MNAHRFSSFPVAGLRFLRSLKRNNNREWFQERKALYESAVKTPLEELVQTLAGDFGRFAPEMVATPKASIYRIYRDTRFSKDKSPYKTHAAVIFPRRGLEKHQGAGFYLHIAPTELFIGGGVYMPMSEDLNAIRSHIAENSDALFRIVKAKPFRKMFGELRGEQLSRIPRGFSEEHPAAEYLKYKQYVAGRTLPPEQATAPRFYKTVVDTFETMTPLIRYLNEPLLRMQRSKAFVLDEGSRRQG